MLSCQRWAWRPRTQLAIDAGIDCGRGIKTDRQLKTNIDNVYAIGDCAEVDGHVLVCGTVDGGRESTGSNAHRHPYRRCLPAMPVTIKTPACPVCLSPVCRDTEGSWVISGKAPDIKALFHNPAGELLGFALTGQAVKERLPLTKQLPDILKMKRCRRAATE